MTEEARKNYIITKKAREKLVKARAGEITLPKIIGMAFGDGGVDAGGTVVPPSDDQETLAHELFRKPVKGYTFPVSTTCRYECLLEAPELAGEYISEVGLYDEDGDIVCIRAFMRKGKDGDIEQTYTADDIF